MYWHEWDGAQLEAITEIINNFNTNNEWGITVSTVELGSTSPMAEAMSAGITSGDLPNLVGGFANNAQKLLPRKASPYRSIPTLATRPGALPKKNSPT